MNFLLHKTTVAFNINGDALGYYDIIAWDWNGPEWSFEIIGSASLSPVHLDINKTKIQWHGKNNQVMRHGRLPGDCFMLPGPGGVMPTQSRTETLHVRLPQVCSPPARDASPTCCQTDAQLDLGTSDPRLC